MIAKPCTKRTNEENMGGAHLEGREHVSLGAPRAVARSLQGNQAREEPDQDVDFMCPSKVWIRLAGEGNSNSHGARPVHQIISMMKRIRTSRLSIEKSLCADPEGRQYVAL